MKENKLGTYLTSFTENDWTAYYKFSKSLYPHNSDYQLVINHIKKHKSRYDSSYMDSEYLRKKIRPFASKQVFSNVISGLCKHIEKYLTWTEVENDPMMKDTLLLQALGKRGLTNQFHKQKQKSKTRRESLPKGLWNNYHDFMAEYLLYYCNMTSDINVSKVALKVAFNSIKEFNSMLNYYLIVEMHNRNILANENWSLEILEFEQNYKIKHVHSEVMEQLIKMKVSKSENSYEYLLQQVRNEKTSKEIRYTILVHLRSYLSYKIIKGQLEVKAKLLELQQYGLTQGILFPSGKIPLIRFTNILNTACSLNNFDWAVAFVSNWSHLVGNNDTNETKSIGYAQIEFSKKNFTKVIDLLIDLRFKSYRFESLARWLLLCSNYELNINNYTIIEYNVSSFKNFNRRNRNKASELTYLSYNNCAKHILHIARGKNMDQTIQNIKNEKNLIYRNWILLKASEKKNKK